MPVERCPVAVPAIEAALPRLAPLVMALASRKGALRLTLTAAAAGLDLAVEGAKPLDGPLRARLPAMARAAGVVRLAVAGDTVVEAAPPTHRLGAARVLPPPGAFLQPTLEGAAALTAAVVEALAPSLGRGARVADLFAGIGTFALPLAGHAAVHAVEVDGGALAALDRGWRGAAGQGLSRITTERRNLMRRPLLADELAPFDAVVIDPPYAGAETQARALAASTVPRIASVSCNPASFARDAAILAAGGYRLAWVQPVDQFFWSAHVEVVGAFERA
ncbi:MAG: RsmD family RNA methyltransferase [Pseudomonadota bacterium]